MQSEQPAPDQLASFDQTLAALSANVDALIEMYRAEMADGQHPDVTTAGLSEWLLASHDAAVLSEHLAVAVRRLHEKQAGFAELWEAGFAEGLRLATEGSGVYASGWRAACAHLHDLLNEAAGFYGNAPGRAAIVGTYKRAADVALGEAESPQRGLVVAEPVGPWSVPSVNAELSDAAEQPEPSVGWRLARDEDLLTASEQPEGSDR